MYAVPSWFSHSIEEWQFDQEILALQRRNTGTVLQNAYIFNLLPFPRLYLPLTRFVIPA